MTDPFSLAAGSFAVLGVAGEICRSVKELYTFLEGIKSAPREIQQLKAQLLDLDVIVADVKDYWAESQAQSGSGQHVVVPTFISSLDGFKTELEVLRSSLKLNSAGKPDIGERIKWVLLKEQKIVQSMQRLESHKTTLIAALTIVGRRNDVVLHREIGALKTELEGLLLKREATPKRIFQVPSTSSDFFTGRKKELNFIEQTLAKPSTVQHRAVIWGCAGAGKTQLALAYAYRHEKDYDAVFWVSASSSDAMQRSFAGLSRHLVLPEGDDPDLDQSPSSQQKAVMAVMTWLRQKSSWLLIIDNADNLKEINIKSYFPTTTQGHIIITSRNRQSIAFGLGIELGEMDAEEAKELLLARAGLDSPDQEDQFEAASIVKSLGYLALAIDHAGAYIQSVCGTLEDYHEQFKNNRAETLKDKPAVSTYEESVFRTFEISYEKIQERNPVAASLLLILCFLDQECADESLMVTTAGEVIDILRPHLSDKVKYNAALRELLEFSLIRRKTEGCTRLLTLHPLIHHWCRDRLSPQDQRRWRLKIAICLIVAAVQDKKKHLTLVPHVMYIIRLWMATPSEEDEEDDVKSFCHKVAILICFFYTAWYHQGSMLELSRIGTRVARCLSNTAAEHGLSLLVAMSDFQAIAADYVRMADSAEAIRMAFLEEWLSEPAREILASVRDGNTSYNLPTTLAETFKHVQSDDSEMLAEFLEVVSRQAASQKKWDEALLLARYSELPYEKGGVPITSMQQHSC
jgi:hypothetical protein